jgi:hypothetical protein
VRVEALSPGRYRVQFTASAALRDKLERLKVLMRSSVPDGDLATVIEQAVTEKLARLEARRFATVGTPRQALDEARTRPSSRHVPAAIRRAVYARDGGQCAYRDRDGRRCPERHHLELHHRRPFGVGGDHGVGTLSLLCRTHNTLMADHDYGREAMARFRRPASPAAGARALDTQRAEGRRVDDS